MFVRATGKDNKTGKDKNLDISFPFHNLPTMIDSLITIKNENDDYFDES